MAWGSPGNRTGRGIANFLQGIVWILPLNRILSSLRVSRYYSQGLDKLKEKWYKQSVISPNLDGLQIIFELVIALCVVR
jgi:hypothetical protein